MINRENLARAAPRDVRSMAGSALMAISYELSDVYRTPASQSCTKSQSDPSKMAPDSQSWVVVQFEKSASLTGPLNVAPRVPYSGA